MPGNKIARAVALEVAERLTAEFAFCASRIKVAGSVRRGKAYVKDLELIMLSDRVQRPTGLFDEVTDPVPHQFERINEMEAEGLITRRLDDRGRQHFGPKSQRVMYGGIPVDIFVCYDERGYGVMELIRTGPFNFSRLAVTATNAGGLIYSKYKVEDSLVVLRSETSDPFDVPNEEEFFTYLDCPFIEPHLRYDFAREMEAKRYRRGK